MKPYLSKFFEKCQNYDTINMEKNKNIYIEILDIIINSLYNNIHNR